MKKFNYKDLSTAEQIKEFYNLLECPNRDYRNEIDNEYMNLMLTHMWELAFYEDQMYDLEYLSNQVENVPSYYIYSAEELEALYEVLIPFRDYLFEKHNINN